METIARFFLILMLLVLPSALVAQADSARSVEDGAAIRAKAPFVLPVGIRTPKGDTTTHASKEYHGLRWTLIGAGVGGLLGGGATAYLVSFCSIDGDCRGAWRWIAIGTGVGAIIVGFFAGWVYGLFNG